MTHPWPDRDATALLRAWRHASNALTNGGRSLVYTENG